MDQVKAADSAVVCAEEIDAADQADIDMAMEKLEKEAVEVNVSCIYHIHVHVCGTRYSLYVHVTISIQLCYYCSLLYTYDYIWLTNEFDMIWSYFS